MLKASTPKWQLHCESPSWGLCSLSPLSLQKESELVGPILNKYRSPSLWRKCIYTEFLVLLAAFFGFLSWNQNLCLPSCWLAHCQLFSVEVCFILPWHGTDTNVAIRHSLLAVFAFLKSWKFIIGIIKLSSYCVLDATM